MRRRNSFGVTTLLATWVVLVATASGQTGATPTGPVKLLDPLLFTDGRPVTKAEQWPGRRNELMALFEREEFGQRPESAERTKLEWRVEERSERALGGLALRKRITITFPAPTQETLQLFPGVAREMHLLLYTPMATRGRAVPVVLGLSFTGIWTISGDTGVPLGRDWRPGAGPTPASEKDRGTAEHNWALKMLLEHGYGVAVIYYGDLEPDQKRGWQNGVRPLFFHPGQTVPGQTEWGALSVWAWGLSKAMDYLVTDPEVDSGHVAVFGHSRLGKAADWAAATDQRFWMLLSNEAGKGGDSLIRRCVGEPNSNLWNSFPYWFTAEFGTWSGRDAEVPFDGNLLLALTAPRPIYVASAIGDAWSDPEGEFLSIRDASRVEALLGRQPMHEAVRPALDTPILGDVGYHIRTGKHDVNDFDWAAFIRFMEMHRREPRAPEF